MLSDEFGIADNACPLSFSGWKAEYYENTTVT
jgi:hypothetical protein